MGLTGNDFRPGHTPAAAALVCLFLLYMVNFKFVCRHPLDQQNTRVLQLLPGLEMLTKSIMGERAAKCGSHHLAKPYQI